MSLWRRQKFPESYRFWKLATYNAERARGILHTEEWQEKMSVEQALFDGLYGAQPPPPDRALSPDYDIRGGP